MANSKSAFVFSFFLVSAFCNVPIRGRNLTNAQGDQNSSSNVPALLIPDDQHLVHYAGYSITGKWHGVRAKINVWPIPDVLPMSYSAALIEARDRDEMMVAGIHVHPGLYKNNDLHFFTFWTNSHELRTGCYNTDCEGFVVANGANLFPGQALSPSFSNYGGDQKFLTLRLKKDEKTGDWSLYREDQGGPIGGMTLLGWWPRKTFKLLSDYASQIKVRGTVSYHRQARSPPMGSGRPAQEFEGKAASFLNILGFDTDGKRFDLDKSFAYRETDKEFCYNLSDWFKGKHTGSHFFYGGPSGCNDG